MYLCFYALFDFVIWVYFSDIFCHDKIWPVVYDHKFSRFYTGAIKDPYLYTCSVHAAQDFFFSIVFCIVCPDLICGFWLPFWKGLSWSYGSWIYNYLCNRCISPLTVNPTQTRCTRYNIMWSSLSVTCGWWVAFSGFLHQ